MRRTRILVDLLLIIAAFWLPWWLVLILCLVGLFWFQVFWEVVLIGLILDSLYSAPLLRFHHIQFVVTIVALIMLIGAELIKKQLRVYG